MKSESAVSALSKLSCDNLCGIYFTHNASFEAILLLSASNVLGSSPFACITILHALFFSILVMKASKFKCVHRQ